MKLNREKFTLAKARACMGQSELEQYGICRSVQRRAANGGEISIKTAGKIAKALGVDVLDIIENTD